MEVFLLSESLTNVPKLRTIGGKYPPSLKRGSRSIYCRACQEVAIWGGDLTIIIPVSGELEMDSTQGTPSSRACSSLREVRVPSLPSP